MFSLFNTNRRLSAILPSLCICLLTFTLLNFQSTAANAQAVDTISGSNFSSDTTVKRFEIGLVAGASFNYLATGQPHTGANTGVTAGFSLNYTLFRGVSLQLEANFLQQGGRTVLFKDDTRLGLPESIDTKNVTNSSYILNSIEVPLLVHYTFPIKQSWQPSVYIGASYANTFNVKENYQKTGDLLPGEDIIATVSGSRNPTTNFNTSKMNFIIGANLKLPLTSRVQLLIDMRYLNGLTPSRENYSYMDKVGFGSDIRANSFLSRLGVIMPL